MKKVLNLLLVFVLSAVVVGVGFSGVKAEATTDVTITLHIHQYDGDYTNSGTGIWDGITWNNWGDTVSSTDNFGGVIVKTYTAAEINAVGDSMEFKPTKDVNVDDSVNYLAPASIEGKVFLDVTALKSGAKTALDVYYVEGSTEFVSASPGFGLIFVVYADPTVAANESVYDAWNMWTWNNGTLGSVDGVDFNQDMMQNTGTYDVAMKLGVLKVASDADQNTGFIVRTEDWSKQCATDIMIDNTSVRGSGTLVYYYQAKTCVLGTDGAAFLSAVDTAFEMNAGNRFIEGTMITSPTTVAVKLLMPKNPAAYDVSKFTLYGPGNVMIPILSAQADTMEMVGTYVSDTTCSAGENLFVLYVSSTLDHSLLGVVGSLQGWNPGGAILSTKDDSMGNAVFEICTSARTGEFKVLYDLDNDGFTWDGVADPNVTRDNQAFNFGNERMAYYYIDANVPTVSADTVGTFVSDFTPLEGEKTVIIHFDTPEARDKISVVGAFVQAWDPASLTPYISTKDDTSGYAVFEVPTTSDTGEFKILFDSLGDGFAWGDTELTSQLAYDLTGVNSIEIFISVAGDVAYIVGGTAVATPLETTNVTLTFAAENELQFGSEFYVTYDEVLIENHVTVFVSTLLDHTKLGIVGSIQGWDVANAILSTQDSSLGYAVFEFIIKENSGEFKVLFDDDGTAGLNWGDKEVTPGDNQTFTVGSSGNLVLFIDAATEPDTVTAAEVGTFVSDFTPLEGQNTLIIHFDTALLGTDISAVGAFVQSWDPASLTPYISTKVDTMGYAVFEIPTALATGEFKILHDADANGFAWGDAELTIQFGYDFGETTVLELFITAAGDMVYIVEGSFIPYPVNEVITDMGLVGTITQELFAVQYLDEVIMSEILEFSLSNNFVPADVIGMNGTYALTPTEISIAFMNGTTGLVSLDLIESGNSVRIEGVRLTNPGPGEYTETLTCTEVQNKLLVYIKLIDSSITELVQLGLVGDIQGWNIGATIPPTGMDSNGNYVFEVCVDKTVASGAFKIKLDTDSDGYAWDSVTDPEMTPTDILFNFNGTTSLYLEEGATAVNSSKFFTMELSQYNILDVTKEYQLVFVDDNGFKVFIDLDIDKEAPEGQFSYKPNTPRVIDEDETFVLMNYFNTLLFLDNHDGELVYEIITDLDMTVYGEQTVVVGATDAWNNVGTLSFVFTVNDVTNPVLTGDTELTFTVGDAAPAWASLVTSNEGTIVVNTSQVDMDTVGSFFVNYTATDNAGNSSTLSIEVTIEAAVEVDEPGLSAGIIAAIVVGSIAVIGGAVFFFIKKP